jgi:hypothetical protein
MVHPLKSLDGRCRPWFAPETSGNFGKALSIQPSAFSPEAVRMRDLNIGQEKSFEQG